MASPVGIAVAFKISLEISQAYQNGEHRRVELAVVVRDEQSSFLIECPRAGGCEGDVSPHRQLHRLLQLRIVRLRRVEKIVKLTIDEARELVGGSTNTRGYLCLAHIRDPNEAVPI